ncbi:hypothetical protein [Polyangium aurulentum]|uniref:hypothetical protein n=1 Tax=Polyangium aurulentum TaxID=2567896 RepID=UPI00197D5C88|nr:hypothetical protein [Polyangium aurulentum]UQA57985.1 hypothetical protein E8A73_043070 [Polyangium aurulentum]
MAKSYLGWVLPGLFFTIGFGFAACVGADPTGDDCEPTGAGSGAAGGGGGAGGASPTSGGGAQSAGDPETSEDGDNNFHHPMDPTQPGQQDPFEILKKRAAEGPPEVRTRLHSCSKLTYSSLGEFLVSRGVNLDAVAVAGQPPTAGQLYKSAATKDALGVANFDARMGEAYFYTISAATKLFDIFVQAAPEIIEKADEVEACKISGTGYPVFNAEGNCTYYGLSCIMGRPATDDDMELCNLMVSQADGSKPADLPNKRALTVAAFLAAAHTCQ